MEGGSANSLQGRAGLSAGDRLDSWKEIAAYLRREVRTVQRWEKNEGLPVHRHQHDKQGSVYAYRSELDVWWKERRPRLEQEQVWESVPLSGEAAEAPAVRPMSKLSVTAAVAVAILAVLAVGYWVRQCSGPLPSVRGKSKLLVMPFANLSGDPQQEFFSDGFTDEMITQLSQLGPDHLGVIARGTSMLYKGTNKNAQEIGQELDVDYILEGSVRRAGNRVRITAQLIKAHDQTHLWSQIYDDRDVRDILGLQSEVARAIASEIQLTLTPQVEARLAVSRKVNPAAYEAYLQGLSYLSKRTPDALERSVEYFRQATQGDSDYALAHAGLATSYALLGQVPNDALPPKQAMTRAKDAAARAMKLNGSLPEAYAVMGLIRHSYDWDWRGAERAYQRALELNPSYATARQWYSLLLHALGRHEEAMAQIEQAKELDPLAMVIRSTVAQAYYFSRQYDRVIEQCRKVLEVEPNLVLVRYHLGRAYLEKGMVAEALAELEKANTLAGGHPSMQMALGHAYGIAGRRADALQILQELNQLASRRYVPGLYFAAIHTGLGDKDRAFEWLERAYRERSDYLVYLNVEPMADPLRADLRFQNLIRRVGLSTHPPRAAR